MLNNILYLLFGIDGPVYLNDHWIGLACNIGAYIWKNLPFWTSSSLRAVWLSRRSCMRPPRWTGPPASADSRTSRSR